MGLLNTETKSTPFVQLNILLYFLFCGPIFMLEVLDILFRDMASGILSNTNRLKKNQKENDSVRNVIMGQVWIFQLENNPKTNLKNTSKLITGHKTKLLLWPFQSSDMTWPQTLLKMSEVN